VRPQPGFAAHATQYDGDGVVSYKEEGSEGIIEKGDGAQKKKGHTKGERRDGG